MDLEDVNCVRVVSQVRRAKLGFVYQVKVLILEALAKHQVPSVA